MNAAQGLNKLNMFTCYN